MSDTIGTCEHGHVLHYRYPCWECARADFVAKMSDEFAAGFTPETGLLSRLANLHVAAMRELAARLTQNAG